MFELDIEIYNLSFDLAQDGEPVEPFGIWCLCIVISSFSGWVLPGTI